MDSRNRKVYFVPSAREYSTNKYAETLGSDLAHHLIVYDIKTGERNDLGVMQTHDGRRVFGCEAASVGPEGNVYICGRVEVRDAEKATGFIRNIPVSMQLIIFKPE